MSGALDPIQQDLPLEEPSSRPAGAPQVPVPPSLFERAWVWLRALPWQRWRSQATPVIQSGATQLGKGMQIGATQVGKGMRIGAVQAGQALRVAVTRGTPYTVKLVRATAKLGVFRSAALTAARAIHVVGFPAVVLRTTIQLLIVHRSGLTIEEATFFRLEDPAGYVVYQAPSRLSTALAVAWLPGAAMGILSLICLIPALVPHRILMLPTTWLTVLQIWLGLAFAAHVLPAYEEAGPLAEQARVGLRNADPIAVLTFLPAWAIGKLTSTGGALPAVVGALAFWWLGGALLGR